MLDYIVAAHPFAILQLIRERDSARHALHFLRHKIAGHDLAFQEAEAMAEIGPARAIAEVDEIPAAAIDDDSIGITEMRLCEASRVVLRPGRIYRFTVDPECQLCKAESGIAPPSE